MTQLPVLRISHSAVETWKECPEKYYYKYVRKFRSIETGASLAFGIALENGVNCLLLGHRDNNLDEARGNYLKWFMEGEKGWRKVFDNSNIKYSTKLTDLDLSLFQKEDLELISTWEDSLNVSSKEAISAIKQRAFKKVTKEQQKLFERLCWLTMKTKGELLLKHFESEVLPKIKKVLAIQLKIEGNVEGKDVIGYVDAILEIEGFDFPIICDIKTAALKYDDDSVSLSPQLTLYTAALSESFPEGLAGFIVFNKALGKDSVCSKCHKPKEKGSMHRTCARGGKNRCGGAWLTTPKPNIQIIVDKITQKKQDKFMFAFSEAARGIEAGIRGMNLNACFKWGICELYEACHNDNFDGLEEK